MLKQSLQQKLLQKLSPQQIQLIKLLEVPTLQLEQRIKKEIEENPALEEGNDSADDEYAQEDDYQEDNTDEFSIDDYIEDDEIPNYKLQTSNYSKDDEHKEVPYSEGASFHEFLRNQLLLKLSMKEEDRMLAEYIIGNIDDDGYLRRHLKNIVDDLAFSQGIKTNETTLYMLLKRIQELDPPGVGARDLQECLLLQIMRKDQKKETVAIAEKILRHHFTEFTKKHYEKIIKRLNITRDQLKEALDEILHLNPKPGGAFSDSSATAFQTIIPDFILETNNGKLELSLNSRNAPELHINQTYSEMLQGLARNKKNRTKQDKDAITFVKQKLDSARWFIDAIQQRQATLLLTMNAILEYQYSYFLEGDERKLHPMILKDIAEETGLDISTISRVANSKYLQTDFGIFPLKSFFSEGMQTEDGEEVSTREIKNILQECIDNESKKKPLTDEKLTNILKEKGYKIARRTVAKYREQLDIPVARLRKEV
ncbi:MAG: RNA polymerase factor sigma-54 [Salinivirgaceae bacterium]|jgi:RNA polymerase sigma-54 factor|nr:RNA polymerase factor sigma-54 [Salinivirgaceae bacterium]